MDPIISNFSINPMDAGISSQQTVQPGKNSFESIMNNIAADSNYANKTKDSRLNSGTVSNREISSSVNIFPAQMNTSPFKGAKAYNEIEKMSGPKKYAEDQLLSSPGGDHYYLDQKRIDHDPVDQSDFLGRVGKDISDAFSNVKKFFKDMFFGSKVLYKDQNDLIQEAEQRGAAGSVVDFFKDLGSALSFGAWRPDNEEEPQGFVKRCGFFFSKMKEAVMGDIVQGVSGSIVRMGEDLLFAGWNFVEAIPDATIGQFEKGKKLTTAFFDTGQVVMDYLTDIMPSGEAWVRVHSMSFKDFKLPVLNNIGKPESDSQDSRWQFVRNTPFRKTIETIGSLATDILTLKILGDIKSSSEKRNQGN